MLERERKGVDIFMPCVHVEKKLDTQEKRTFYYYGNIVIGMISMEIVVIFYTTRSEVF